jgi:hypothetical protein
MTDITPHQPDNRKNGENDPEAYKVGYRKPPLHSRSGRTSQAIPEAGESERRRKPTVSRSRAFCGN